MSEAYDKVVLRECAKELVPKLLMPDFRRDREDLAGRLRRVYEQFLQGNHNGSSTKKGAAASVIKSWLKGVEANQQYERYSQLMREMGKVPFEKQDFFRGRKIGGYVSKRFMHIENNNIKVGSRVRSTRDRTQKPKIVAGFTTTCDLIFETVRGKRVSNQSPLIYKVCE